MVRRRRFMGMEVSGKIGLITVIIMLCCQHVRATPESEPEIFFGPAFTSLDSDVEIGFGFGGGLNIGLLPFAGGMIELRGSLMPVFAVDSAVGFTMTQAHIPLTVAIAFLERSEHEDRLGLGGSIGFGLMSTLGKHSPSAIDVRPCFTIDLTFGIFERGALKFRYTTVVGNKESTDGRSLSYQTVTIIGSTSW